MAHIYETAYGNMRTFYPFIAAHAKNAEEFAMAFKYFLRAGNSAQASFQNDEVSLFLLFEKI